MMDFSFSFFFFFFKPCCVFQRIWNFLLLVCLVFFGSGLFIFFFFKDATHPALHLIGLISLGTL